MSDDNYEIDIPFNWEPENSLLKKLLILARRSDRTPEAIITEAVELYLENQQPEIENSQLDDPIIGLFKGSPDLATRSEEILKEDITEKSGWTWKEPNQQKKVKKYTLDKLLANTDPSDYGGEIDWGNPMGNEEW